MHINDAAPNPGNVGCDIPDILPAVANFVVCSGVAVVVGVTVGTGTIPAPPGPALYESVDEVVFSAVESTLPDSSKRGTSGHSGQSGHSSVFVE